MNVTMTRPVSKSAILRILFCCALAAHSYFNGAAAEYGAHHILREAILREIALWSAVEGADETTKRMHAVPEARRDGQLLEWWARYDLARGDWANVVLTIAAMPAKMETASR